MIPRADREARALREFLDSEASGGLVLIGAAALALMLANSPTYFGTLEARLGPLSLIHWINDALMAVFFLFVGLEMKRELIGGQLATWPLRILPGIAAASVLRSGVHPTMAGVTLALFIPLGEKGQSPTPLHRLEHALAPWVGFLIVPLFGLANAGVPLAGMSPASLAAPIPLGIAAGLFLGKQLGVFAAVWAAIKLKLAPMPDGASPAQVYGVALLCGIGFTMSLFIGLLAFPASVDAQEQVKVGVLLGSLLSALIGALVLAVAGRAARRRG